MKKTHIVSGVLLLLMLGVCGILLLELEDSSIPESIPEEKRVVVRDQQKILEKAPVVRKNRRRASIDALEPRADETPVIAAPVADSEMEEEETEAEAPRLPKYVEEIKAQIYARNIDSVDQIRLLDDLVQTGDRDTRDFWGDGWSSVDDWKKETNGFRLEKKEDGSMVFNPDEITAGKYTFFENPLSYTYDEVNREFVSEIDYYGKTIYNVAKFIKEDVLVMMTISGTKVNLNIYQKEAGQQGDFR